MLINRILLLYHKASDNLHIVKIQNIFLSKLEFLCRTSCSHFYSSINQRWSEELCRYCDSKNITGIWSFNMYLLSVYGYIISPEDVMGCLETWDTDSYELPNMGSVNWTLVLCKINKCFELLSNHSRHWSKNLILDRI